MDLNQFHGLNTGKREAVPTAASYVTATDVDWSLKHFFVLLFIGAGCGILSSYLIHLFNTSPSFSTLLSAVLGLCALLTVIVFQSLLLKSFQLILWVTLAEIGGLLSFFYATLTPWLVFGAIALAGYCISGFLRGRLDLTDHLTVHFGRFAKIILGSGIAGFALFLALFYVGIYRTNGISFGAFQFVTAGAAPILERFVPGYNADVQAETFFQEFARQQLKNNPQFVLLLTADQEEVVAQTGYQLRNQIAQATKTSVRSGETFESYMYRVLVHYSEAFNSQQLRIVPILIILLAIYSIIRGIMFLFKWPIIFVNYLIYRILLSVRLVYITTEPRSKEIIMTK
ncbi:MAG: hypothetical protein Q7R62_01485 [bacterium]|nr:hypothetical protein [bacterium]